MRVMDKWNKSQKEGKTIRVKNRKMKPLDLLVTDEVDLHVVI